MAPRKASKKGFQPVHAVETAEPGFYLNLDDAAQPRITKLAEASTYSSRLDACTRLTEVRAPLPPYNVVRIDA